MPDVLSITQFTAAAWMIGLSAWLLVANPRGSACRAFALFLVLRAVQIISLRLAGSADAVDLEGVWYAFSRYALIAQVPVLFYFVFAYLNGLPKVRWALATLAATVALEFVYLRDHCLDACPGIGEYGPLTLVTAALPLGLAAAAYIMDGLRRDPDDVRGPAAGLVALALGLNALLEGGIGALTLVDLGVAGFAAQFSDPTWPMIGIWMQTTGAVTAAAVLAARVWRRPTAARLTTLGLSLGVLATAAFIVFGAARNDWGFFFVGVWRMVLPAFATYALIRHRMFAIDARVRWTVSHGAIAGVVIIAYFLISELSEALVSDRFGQAAGLATAAMLLIALRPLESLTDRFVSSLLPRDEAKTRDERFHLYESQAQSIWADGQMTGKERAILDHLRDHLQIGTADALRIEQAAEAAGLGRDRQVNIAAPG